MGQYTHAGATAPATGAEDPLTEHMQRCAREPLKQAVEAELQRFHDSCSDRQLADCTKKFIALNAGLYEADHYCPGAHWQSIRTTNPITSMFATVRLRPTKIRGCVTRDTISSLAVELDNSAQTRWRWRRLLGNNNKWLDELVRGLKFIDGVEQG